MNWLQRKFNQYFPPDPDSDDRAGALGIYFDSDYFWFFKEAAAHHDNRREMIQAGTLLMTNKENDRMFVDEVKALIVEMQNKITPAQKRWALLWEGGSWPVVRLVSDLRGTGK